MLRLGGSVWLVPIVLAATVLAIRPLLSESLGHDEAEQLHYAQQLQWGYSQQPPLFIWLSWAALQCLGSNLFGLAIIRVAIYALLFFFTAKCLRELGAPAAVAIWGALTLLFVPFLGWKLIFSYMHTLAATTLFAGTVWLALRLLRAPTLGNYLALGMLVGLGMLAKYNFALFCVALLIAGLSLADTRGLILSRRMALAGAVASLVVLPHALWVWEHRARVGDALQWSMNLQPAPWHWLTVASTLGMWLRQVLKYVLPVVAGIWMLLPSARRWLLAPLPEKPLGLMLVERTAALILLLTAGVIFLGLGWFRSHWLAPAAPLMPLILFGRLRVCGVALPWRRLAAGVLVAVLGMLGYRIAQSVDRASPASCGQSVEVHSCTFFAESSVYRNFDACCGTNEPMD
jgi:4-amino-4-deoxy-L-arabinose transferase-like glycosyltransferase